MNLTVAVRATPVKEENRAASARRAGMSRGNVTLGAKSRIGNFEQPVVHRAMRLVAVGAVLDDRRVLPEKGTAPFRMTRVAIFIDACLFELGRIRASMRIVTVGACHLSFPNRHVRRAHQLGFSLQMTLAANFGLGPFVEERGSVSDLGQLVTVGELLHDGVAVDAGDSPARVRTRFPIGLNSSLMAGETGLVLNLGGLAGIFTKRD